MNLPTPTWARDEDVTRLRERIAELYAAPTRKTVSTIALNGDDRFVAPAWIEKIRSAEDRDRARLRFFVRLAALYASREGSVSNLSVACGLNPRALPTYIAPNSGRRQVSAAVARRIEAACDGVVTRAQINPEAFAD